MIFLKQALVDHRVWFQAFYFIGHHTAVHQVAKIKVVSGILAGEITIVGKIIDLITLLLQRRNPVSCIRKTCDAVTEVSKYQSDIICICRTGIDKNLLDLFVGKAAFIDRISV